MKLLRLMAAVTTTLVAVACLFSPAAHAASTQAVGMRCPVPGSNFIDSWLAPRVGHLHQGVDMMAPDGTPIYAPEGGTYRQHGNDSFYLDGDSGTQYFGTHLQEHVHADGRVEAGDLVALVGHTGNASPGAPHLHFEIHPAGGPAVNPYPATITACTGPSPEVVAALGYVAKVGAPPSWPYGPLEIQRWWNLTHNPNIGPFKAQRLAAFFNAVVEHQLGQYLLATYLSRAQATSCSGPADCAAMVRSVFASRGLDGDAAVRVMMCESGGNPRASNGGRFLGLFQQMASAWPSRAAAHGVAGRSAFDGYANAVVSAGMVAHDGGWRQWSCRP